MTLKWFVVASAMLAGFGVYTAHAQVRPSQSLPPAAGSSAAKPKPAASPLVETWRKTTTSKPRRQAAGK